MISSNVAGYTKKQLTAAIVFTGYCVGNIIGPQTFLNSEARKSPLGIQDDFPLCRLLRQGLARYKSAYIAMLVGYTIKLLMVFVLYFYMYRENKRRDAAGYTNEEDAVEAGMRDTTELDNKGFRYSL